MENLVGKTIVALELNNSKDGLKKTKIERVDLKLEMHLKYPDDV